MGKQKLIKISKYKKKNSINKDLCYGSIAGCMALTITYPTDVIRRRL
jgi:hypothetical protein